MVEMEELSVGTAIDEIVREPIRGIRRSVVRLAIEPGDLVVRTPRPGALRRLLGTLVAAASWGGGLRSLTIEAGWDAAPGAAAGGALRVGVRSRRNFQDRDAQAGWHGVEQVLLGELRRTLDVVGGGELSVRTGPGELACEIRLSDVEPAVGWAPTRTNGDVLAQRVG